MINSIPYLENPDLVRIEVNEWESVCSGYYVNPTSIITAAHCIRNKNLKQMSLFTNAGLINLQIEKLISHPTLDIGIIKTSAYQQFEGRYPLSYEVLQFSGDILLLGAGKIDIEKKQYGFSSGKNHFFHLGNKLYILGASETKEISGENVSVAPNDSGSPMLMHAEIVAIAIKSSVNWTDGTILPALSIGLALTDEDVSKFLKLNL